MNSVMIAHTTKGLTGCGGKVLAFPRQVAMPVTEEGAGDFQTVGREQLELDVRSTD